MSSDAVFGVASAGVTIPGDLSRVASPAFTGGHETRRDAPSFSLFKASQACRDCFHGSSDFVKSVHTVFI
jgi:hypothetical protein